MKKNLLYLLPASLLFGCLSNTEKDAIKAIKNVYGTPVSYTKGFKSSTATGDMKYFGIEVGEGKFVSIHPPEITAGNIAIYTYRNLSEEDKHNKTHIAVTIKGSKGEVNRLFPLEIMHAPTEQANVFEAFSQNIRHKKFEDAARMIDPKFYKEGSAEAMAKFLEGFIAKHGQIREYKRLGFGMKKAENLEFFEYNGILQFEDDTYLKYNVNTFREPGNKIVASYAFDSEVK